MYKQVIIIMLSAYKILTIVGILGIFTFYVPFFLLCVPRINLIQSSFVVKPKLSLYTNDVLFSNTSCGEGKDVRNAIVSKWFEKFDTTKDVLRLDALFENGIS